MTQVPRLFRRFMPQLIHMFVLPLFYFAFVLLYHPFDLQQHFGTEWFGVHVTVLSCIIFISTVFTRLLYYFLPLRLNYSLYSLWCFGEVFFVSFQCALYLWMNLEHSRSYFDFFALMFESNLFILFFPYIILALAMRIHDLVTLRSEPENTSRMRFYDSNHNLKFVATADTILYIGAEENYINIHYIDNGRVKCYVLRNSMRSVDELCLSNGLVRCHRSFYVNPSHVRVLRKEKEGVVVAELDVNDVRDIPVSKKFYDNLAVML